MSGAAGFGAAELGEFAGFHMFQYFLSLVHLSAALQPAFAVCRSFTYRFGITDKGLARSSPNFTLCGTLQNCWIGLALRGPHRRPEL